MTVNSSERKRLPVIFTASQFKNEVDVLHIRLATIGDLVDVIVIAEATVDQRGRPKPLVFPEHRERFRRWDEKIRYIVVDDMPTGSTHDDDVRRERHQRDALIRGMPDLQPDDLVYVSDLDEIPYPEALADGIANAPLRFGMDLHVYALNWRWLERGCRIGTLGAVLNGEAILRQGVCHSVLWDNSVRSRPGVSGWHLTYQGGVESIRSKITGMMDKHEALVMPGTDPASILTDEWIRGSIETGRDIFGRTFRPSEWVDLDQLPPIVQAKPDLFWHMMVPRPANQDEIESVPRCTCGGCYDKFYNVRHFEYCALMEEPGVDLISGERMQRPRAELVPGDARQRPRSLDV